MSTILVTGESRGVGLVIVKKILETTNFKVLGISRTESKEVLTLQNKYKERFIHLNFDLTDYAKLKCFFNENLKKHGPYSGYINNAAIAYDDLITNMNIDALTAMFAVNVYSPIHLTKLILRDMLLSKTKGSIVHISSISAHTGYKGLSMYAATKGAIEAFSKNTAREWGEVGIRSNCVCPGFMDTEMSKNLSDEQRSRIYLRTSLKKETDIESVASTAVFLLRDDSNSITGQIIHVDNGTI